MIVLDSNVLSEILKPAPHTNVLRWLNQQVPDTLFITTITIAENLFGVNGIGAALIGAIHANDIPMVQTLAFIFAVLIVTFNLIADVLYGLLDPRIRYD